MRYHNVNNERVAFTPAEEEARDTEEAIQAIKRIENVRQHKYELANKEYIKRGVILTGIKVRGSQPDQALTAMAVKVTHRGGPNASALANLHDKLDALKDLIEVAVDPVAIDVADNVHWT